MATCYIGKGIDMPEFGLCNTTASVSLCCFPGHICLSNGYCSTHSGQIYSGACTDPTYSSSICPEFCTFATGGYITQCEGGSAGENGRFCCSMDTNGTCCDDPKNKLHMAPSASSAIALMPAIATAAASNVSSTTSSTGPLSSTTPSSTLHSNQSSSSSTLSTTAITSNAEPTPASTGRTKLAIGLGIGLGVGALILLFWVIYAYHCRKRGQERFQRSSARACIDALEMVNRANMGVSRGWSSPFNRRENPKDSQQAVRSAAESAKSESAPTTVSRLASSGHHAESQPPSQLPTALPNSQIEQVELRTDSAVDREPTAELEPETIESEQHNSTSQQPHTSNRSETLTSAQLDGTSSQSPDTEKVAPRAPTPEEGSKSQEQPQEEGTSTAKPAENLQVEDEVQRQWSWQYGDDEHLQRSLEEQMEPSQETPE